MRALSPYAIYSTIFSRNMWKGLFLISELIQLASLLQLVRHNSVKKSVFGVSCDFSAFCWIYNVCSAVSALIYLLSPALRSQYAARYPLYPEFNTSSIILVLHLLGSAAATFFVFQVFVLHRRSIGGIETVSLLCKCVLVSYCGFLFWVLRSYVLHRATVNVLDVANCFWFLGALSRAFMFVLQISVNWFFLKACMLHRNFLLFQGLSLSFAFAGYEWARFAGNQWYDIPTNAPARAALALNSVCLLALTAQSYVYRSKKNYSNV